MQQTLTPPMVENETILHDLVTEIGQDPEWPEVPRLFLMRCGEILEEEDLERCAGTGEEPTCLECRETLNPVPEETCTTSSNIPW